MKTRQEWEASGMLEGLNQSDSERLVTLFDQVDSNLLSSEIALDSIIPTIRHIFGLINGSGITNKIHWLDNNQNVVPILIGGINVGEITINLNNFCESFIPTANKYLMALDIQAEMISLFCKNYVFELIRDYKVSAKIGLI